jgi:hypothetical protein
LNVKSDRQAPDHAKGTAARLHSRATTPVLVLVGAMPAVVMGWLVVRHWVPLPFWDEWVTGAMLVSWFDGTLTLRELPAQFNESRALVGRLLQLLLIQFGPWDPRKDMALLFVTVCAITLFFFFMMRRTEHVSGRGAAVAWVGASFLCFSPVQVDNFIYGARLSSLLSSLALVAAGDHLHLR